MIQLKNGLQLLHEGVEMETELFIGQCLLLADSVEKSDLERAAFRQLKNRSISAQLRKYQDSSVF